MEAGILKPRPRRDARRGERGFTIFELLITLAVSVIGMTGVMALHVATIKTNQGSAQAADAVAIATRTLEEARSLSLTQMDLEYEDDGVLPIDYDFGAETVLGRTATYQRRIQVEVSESSDDLIKIRVEISWAEDGATITTENKHTVSLEVLRTIQETL